MTDCKRPNIGDLIEVAGETYEITMVWPKLTKGRPDHKSVNVKLLDWGLGLKKV